MSAVDTDPATETGSPDTPVDPRTIAVWRFGTAFAFVPPAAALLAAAIGAGVAGAPLAWLVWTAWALLLALAAFVAWRYPPARYRHLAYRVDATGITIRDGVFWRTQSSLPHVRIQHTDVSQGPLQRRYGVATLKLYTAGSRYTRTELPGLAYPDAIALRDRLQRQGHGDAV